MNWSWTKGDSWSKGDGKGGWGNGGKDKGKGKGKESLFRKSLEDQLWALPREVLVERCKNARKQGAPAITGRGGDPNRYTDPELREYLMKLPAMRAATEDPNAAMERAGREKEFLTKKFEVVQQVKAASHEEWYAFCEKCQGKFDPQQYPMLALQFFLDGLDPPTLEDIGAADISSFTKGELVVLCKFAVKLGSEPLTGHGRDPNRYPEEDLVNYLQGLGGGGSDIKDPSPGVGVVQQLLQEDDQEELLGDEDEDGLLRPGAYVTLLSHS